TWSQSISTHPCSLLCLVWRCSSVGCARALLHKGDLYFRCSGLLLPTHCWPYLPIIHFHCQVRGCNIAYVKDEHSPDLRNDIAQSFLFFDEGYKVRWYLTPTGCQHPLWMPVPLFGSNRLE